MISRMLSGADVVLVSQWPEVVDIVVPSKLLTALGAGAMIVPPCPHNSETAKLIAESGGGVVVPPSDDIARVDAIDRVRTGRINVLEHPTNARRFAIERFDRNRVYDSVLRNILPRLEQTVVEANLSSRDSVTQIGAGR